MGLAAPKNRSKLSRDPNNTTWTSSTTRFGHRVLTAQGWTPGTTLGAVDAAHAEHYTAGSSSHVRVALRDGNQGIGVRRGPGPNDETFGLTLLSGLLGRLNGKSEEVLAKEERAMRDVKLVRYQGERWGSMGFVFGGYLVGDKIEKSIGEAEEASEENEKKALKRKRDDAVVTQVADTEQVKLTKRSKKSQKSRSESSKEKASQDTTSPQLEIEILKDSSEDPSDIKRKHKEEKRARREARKLKKEQKRLKKAQEQAATSNDDTDLVQSANDRETAEVKTPDHNRSETSTPMFAGGRGRHAIRHKYIQQKQMACMNDKALNEIFMIKSKA